jgi:hypothetical protein
MRTLTLLSVLIASYFANPVVHFENNLVRRASNTKQEDVGVDDNANADENGMAEPRRSGLLDNSYLDRSVQYILYLIGLYNYEDVEDNERLLGLLVDKGDITEEEAEEIEGVNLLGLFKSGHGNGPCKITIF